MKTIKYSALLFAFMAISCSVQEDKVKENVVEEVPYTYFMEELYGFNSECVTGDYLKLECNNQVLEINYGQVNGGLLLCHFAENNAGGIMCPGCEGHFASMNVPNESYNILPQNLPVQIGSVWAYNPEFTVTNINFNGVQVYINIPKRLVTTLKTGVYKIKNEITDPGVSINLNWEVVDNSGPVRLETGYGLGINPHKPYKIELVCIDRSITNMVRLTWKFEGTFAGKSFENTGSDIVYEIPIKGIMSYNIELRE